MDAVTNNVSDWLLSFYFLKFWTDFGDSGGRVL